MLLVAVVLVWAPVLGISPGLALIAVALGVLADVAGRRLSDSLDS